MDARPDVVSTGELPRAELVRALVGEAYERFRGNTDGENSQVYPALARVPSDLFGICVASAAGEAPPARAVAASRPAARSRS